MHACEHAIRRTGFGAVEVLATLAGEPLYAAFGYVVAERFELPLTGGMALPVVRMTKGSNLDAA